MLALVAPVPDIPAWSQIPTLQEEAANATIAASSTSRQPLRAFPTARGFGAKSVGGRGGDVCEVTKLADSGVGSLRACIKASGPRMVVFRTGGTIELESSLVIRNPFITIAGQTAPGGGIAIKANPGFKQDALSIESHDVVIRHVRVRPAATAMISESRSAVNVSRGSHNVVLDHMSLSWGMDNVFEIIDGSHDVTVQWSFITEGLSHSNHEEGEHSRGLNISVKTYNVPPGTRTGSISVHHNLLAHNNKRNLEADAHDTIDFVNNVIYNYGEQATLLGDLFGTTTPTNVVGNYYKAGPQSMHYEVRDGESGSASEPRFYVKGNIGPHRTDDSQPQELIVIPRGRSLITGSRFPAPVVPTTSAASALQIVLGKAGALKPRRDEVDTRIVSDVKNRTGSIIDDPSEVGGWPNLQAGTPPKDSDHDGMPNEWEQRHDLNPNWAGDGATIRSNGYTNLENYLNELAGDCSPC